MSAPSTGRNMDHTPLSDNGQLCARTTRELEHHFFQCCTFADCSHSSDGNAWSSFTYDMARARTFRWGEDGIAGVSDTHGRMNIAFAFWNEKE